MNSLRPFPQSLLVFVAIAAVLGAAAVRFIALGDGAGRPMHVDEATNAVILGGMLAGDAYRYDPQDRHGPALYYAAYPALRLGGATSLADLKAWQLRLLPAVAGLLLAGTVWPLRQRLGKSGAAVAAFLLLGAAPVLYYERYFIHETVFVLFMMGTILALARAAEGRGSLAWAGAGIGLLAATKETAVLPLAAGALAWVILARLEKREGIQRPFPRGPGAAALTAIAVIVLAYTAAGSRPGGLLDLARGGFRFLHRAGGEGHEKPGWTYLAWMLKPGRFGLIWTGAAFLGLGGLGAVAALRDRTAGWTLRFLALFAPLLFLMVSAIPYKTPWLMLDFLVPGAFLAGYGAHRLASFFKGRGIVLVPALALLAAAAMARETARLVYLFPADDRNPLAYSPTVPDVRNLAAAVDRIAAARGGRDIQVRVVAAPDGYWPLPWYLRRYPHVSYYSLPPREFPESTDAWIVSPDFSEETARRLGPGWTARTYGLRPDVLLSLYSR